MLALKRVLVFLILLDNLSGLGETLAGQSLALLELLGRVGSEEDAGEREVVCCADIGIKLVD